MSAACFARMSLLPIVRRRSSRPILRPREVIKQPNIELSQLRAAQAIDDRTKILVDEASHQRQAVQHGGDEVRNALLHKLEREAGEVVALKSVWALKAPPLMSATSRPAKVSGLPVLPPNLGRWCWIKVSTDEERLRGWRQAAEVGVVTV